MNLGENIRKTPVREAIIEILLGTNTPLSIAQIQNSLSKKKLNPNKTTVYREINFLKDLGRVAEVDFGEGKKMYEVATSHHHHIICINCKKVVDVDFDLDEEKILKQKGFKPIGHSLEFFGLCKDCQ